MFCTILPWSNTLKFGLQRYNNTQTQFLLGAKRGQEHGGKGDRNQVRNGKQLKETETEGNWKKLRARVKTGREERGNGD